MDARSERNIKDVHPDLEKVMRAAYELAVPRFTITEGLRSIERQRQLVRSGASQTMKSRHLTGHACDIAFLIGGVARWDWPLYANAARVIKGAALHLGIPIEWGGDWTSFRDGPHFQLPWAEYPSNG